MFGLGMPEILMILAIALIVIGPKKLPDLAKTLGRALGEFKSAAQDFKRTMDLESTVSKRNDDPPVTLKASMKAADSGPGAGDGGAKSGKPGESGPDGKKDSKDPADES